MTVEIGQKRSTEAVSRRIAEHLRAQICREGRPGDRLPSVRQLAREHGVSAGTAVQALSALAGEGLIEQRPREGSFVAGAGGDRHAAVLLEHDIANPNTSYASRRLAQEVTLHLRRRGMPAKLYTGHLDPDHTAGPGFTPQHESTCPEFVEAVQRRALSGVIAVAADPLPQWTEPLSRQGVPVIGHPWHYDSGAWYDPLQMVRDGVAYLRDAGCSRIAFMQWSSPVWDPDRSGPRVWSEFCAAMSEAELPVRMQWVRRDLSPSRPGAGWTDFREIWSAARQKPDGLLVMDDRLMRDAAIGVLQAGVRVPDQLRIVSHANSGSGLAYPFPLAEMVVDLDAIAEAMVEMLVRRRNGEAVSPSRRWLPHRVREVHDPPTAAEGAAHTALAE